MSFIKTLVMTLLVGVMGLIFASIALADNPPQITEQSATFSVTQTDKAVVAVNAKGKIQMRFILRNGLPKAKQTNCVVAANDNKPGHIKIGTVIGNSGVLRTTGHWGKFVDKVKAGDKFCRTGVGPTGWQKVKCGNFVWLKLVSRKGFIPYGRVELVQDFTFKATVSVVARAKGSATAVATCVSSPGNWSQAYGHGEGSAYATATVTFTAKSKVVALSNATARALAMVLSQEGTAKGNAIATASGQAKATATCSSQPAPPTSVPPTTPVSPPTPPAVPPAVTTTVRAITTHDVYSTGEADLCFTVSRSDGSTVDPGAITVSPAEGQMIAGTLKFVSGTGWCQRWKAPVTTVTHNVTWTAYAYGASSSNVMTVRPSDTGG